MACPEVISNGPRSSIGGYAKNPDNYKTEPPEECVSICMSRLSAAIAALRDEVEKNGELYAPVRIPPMPVGAGMQDKCSGGPIPIPPRSDLEINLNREINAIWELRDQLKYLNDSCRL